VAATIRSLLRGEEARCSHGGQVRDFLYTPDLADAFVALLDSPVMGALDVAAGHGTTIAELVMEIAHEIGGLIWCGWGRWLLRPTTRRSLSAISPAWPVKFAGNPHIPAPQLWRKPSIGGGIICESHH
jgi:nucleoside-diphosphate-sugar epimerase